MATRVTGASVISTPIGRIAAARGYVRSGDSGGSRNRMATQKPCSFANAHQA